MEDQHQFLIQSNNALRGKIVEIKNALDTYQTIRAGMSESEQFIFINNIINSIKNIQ